MFPRSDFGWGRFGEFRHGGFRAGRGSMEPIILKLLSEKPMHGYEIISTLEEKSHGMWRPSAGSIYPTLQLLEEKDLVSSKQVGEKKVYELTAAGKKAAKDVELPFGGEWPDKSELFKSIHDLRSSIGGVMGLVGKIAQQQSEEKNAQLKKFLAELEKKLKDLADSPES